MKNYVIGFAFNDSSADRVILIRKNRPDWQKGKWNGVGGKIEPGEKPVAAMVREFEEECGISTHPNDWNQFATIGGADWTCFVFSIFGIDPDSISQKTDELVADWPTSSLPIVIPNLKWLIPAAIDSWRGGFSFIIKASYD